jgi:hypothetical protein
MSDDFLNDAKERYAFAGWPKESHRRAETKRVLLDKVAFPGFTLARRVSLGVPHSYEDFYVSDKSGDARVRIRVVNAGSFDEAKNAMIRRLADCANPNIPRWGQAEGESPVDIGFASGKDGLSAVMFVAGGVFVEIAGVGSENVDLRRFVDAAKRQL